MSERDYSWVTHISTVEAEDKEAVEAHLSHTGWLLLHAAMGKGGQTVLTFAWPYPGDPSPDEGEA